MTRAIAASALFLLLIACAGGVPDSDEATMQRAISTDIAAARFQGATATFPGLSAHDEPIGAYSWQFDQR